MKITLIIICICLLCLIFIAPKEPKALIIGQEGEKKVAKKLKRLNKRKYKVINNIMLQREDNTSSQIDHVIVSIYGIFVIETKNYSGTIKGSEYDYYWEQILFTKKEKLRNPIKQNYSHVKALEENMKKYKYLPIIPIVVFTNNCSLDISTQSKVVHISKLLKTIKKNKERYMSKDKLDNVYKYICNKNVDSKYNRKKHIKYVNKNIKKADKAMNKKRCPCCGGKLKVIKGENGYFYGCSNFPKCRFTMRYNN